VHKEKQFFEAKVTMCMVLLLDRSKHFGASPKPVGGQPGSNAKLGLWS